MSVIYLKHETHGTKVASSENEAKFDESLGWVRFNPEDLKDKKPKESDSNEKPKQSESNEKSKKDEKDMPDFLGSKK